MNTIDIVVGIVLLISGVFALVRGFVHEVLAIAGWILAALAALWGVFRVPAVHDLSRHYIEKGWLADIAAGAVIFLVVLVVASFVTHWVSRHVQRSALGSADRALGFLFGVARGVVLCSLAYMVFIWLEPQPPAWVDDAKSMPLIKRSAAVIESLMPERFTGIEEQVKGQAKDLSTTVEDAKHAKDMYDMLRSPTPRPPDSGDKDNKKAPDYDQKGLDRLIGNTNGQ
jgi:membrane protein required for colicin V production